MMVKEGLYLGFVSCFFWISELIFSRMLFAIAVPSIFEAVILTALFENLWLILEVRMCMTGGAERIAAGEDGGTGTLNRAL
jgi:hypothetical protein